jgi:hypothetical protein
MGGTGRVPDPQQKNRYKELLDILTSKMPGFLETGDKGCESF